MIDSTLREENVWCGEKIFESLVLFFQLCRVVDDNRNTFWLSKQTMHSWSIFFCQSKNIKYGFFWTYLCTLQFYFYILMRQSENPVYFPYEGIGRSKSYTESGDFDQ